MDRREFLGGLLASVVQAPQVSALLVLAADVSSSVDLVRFKLQREGYAYALTHPHVCRVIRESGHGAVGICYVEWAGNNTATTILPWYRHTGDGSEIAERLLRMDRPFAGSTSISNAMEWGWQQFSLAPWQGRRVLDISGDGINNEGPPLVEVRDRLLDDEITINGLPILGAPGQNAEELVNQYRNEVQGGPGSFVLVAESFEDFAYALIGKLMREVS